MELKVGDRVISKTKEQGCTWGAGWQAQLGTITKIDTSQKPPRYWVKFDNIEALSDLGNNTAEPENLLPYDDDAAMLFKHLEFRLRSLLLF